MRRSVLLRPLALPQCMMRCVWVVSAAHGRSGLALADGERCLRCVDGERRVPCLVSVFFSVHCVQFLEVYPTDATSSSSVAMSNLPFSSSKLVQKLITAYFPLYSRHTSSADLSTGFDSLLSTTGFEYVSETPESKLGNIAFYLGLCNTVDNSPSRVVRSSEALFERVVVGEAETLRHSPTTTCESANRHRT